MSSGGAPSRIGAYEIAGELGRGGMGVVYRAVGPDGRPAALKVMSRDLAADEASVARFEREARLAAAVRHENVVALLGSGFEGQLAWIAFEVVEGGSLKDRLRAAGRLPWRDVARLGAQIARGLAAIHSNGLVHRDVKPANVLLDGAGTAKVADLGLARRAAGSATGASIALTKTGELVGTLDYVAPEQVDNAKLVDARADLYSLGATLYDLVAGQPPFEGSSGVALMKKHLVERPTAPSAHADVPPVLDRLILRLLEKDPEARGPGAVELAKELDAIATSSGSRRSPAALAAVVVVVAGAGTVAWLATSAKPAAPAQETTTVTTATTTSERPRSPPTPPDDPRAPAWFRELPADRRPKLPPGVGFGKEKGEYVNEKDGCKLVHVALPHGGKVRPFFIGKFELRNDEFAKFVAETGYTTFAESHAGGRLLGDPDENSVESPRYFHEISWKNPYGPETPSDIGEHPVVQVTFDDAVAYCKWAGLELPNEREWLAAAYPLIQVTNEGKATEKRTLPKVVGNLADETLHAKHPDWKYFKKHTDLFERTAPVGHFPADQSECGAFDMIGNVWELITPDGESQKPRDPILNGGRCTAMGGSCFSPPSSENSNIAPENVAGWDNAEYYSDDLGFRVVKRY
jgi:formylglycine-generating enzyme required for sulfatase activity